MVLEIRKAGVKHVLIMSQAMRDLYEVIELSGSSTDCEGLARLSSFLVFSPAKTIPDLYSILSPYCEKDYIFEHIVISITSKWISRNSSSKIKRQPIRQHSKQPINST